MTDRILPQYEHDGRSLTIPEWATVTGIRSYDISLRLRQGWTLARIIADVKPTNAPVELPAVADIPHVWSEIESFGRAFLPMMRGLRGPRKTAPSCVVQRFTHDGESLTINEWSAKLDLNARTIRSRLHKGWSLEDALAPPSDAKHLVTYDGVTLSHTDWARRLGISRAGLRSRRQQGWTLDKVFSSHRISPHNTLYTHDGKSLTLKQWAEVTGFKYQTLAHRKSKGWSFDRVISTPLGARRSIDAQPEGAMSAVPGGGSATSEACRGPAGDGSREIAPKQAFS